MAYDVIVVEVAKGSVPVSLGASSSMSLGLLGASAFSALVPGPTRRADTTGKNPITSFPTAGYGDCGIHALFGKKSSEGVYRCSAAR